MVLKLDADALTALENSRAGCRYVATASYGDAQTIPDPNAKPGDPLFGVEAVPKTDDGSMTFDATGAIQTSGSLYLSNQSPVSLVPKNLTDPLAPFGQEIQLAYEINAAGQSWQVPMGVYRITDVPDSQEYFRRYPSARLAGWSVHLELKDRFERLQADVFVGPTTPTPGNTVLQEVANLCSDSGVPTDFPPSVADAPIPAGIQYQSDRVDAIAQLLAALNCDPGMTRQGAVTAVARDRWLYTAAADADLIINGVVSMSNGMSNSLYNMVVVTNPNDASLLGVAQITDPSSPLRVDGPLGRRVYTASNPLMTTKDAINQAAQTMLARLSTQQAKTITVKVPPRPDMDLGDVVLAVDTVSGRKVVGQVSQFTAPLDATKEWQTTLVGAEVS